MAVTVPAVMFRPPVKVFAPVSATVPAPALMTPPAPEITPLMVRVKVAAAEIVPPVIVNAWASV